VTRLRKNGRLDSVLRVADFFYWSAEKIVGKLQEQPRYNQKNGNKDYRRCEGYHSTPLPVIQENLLIVLAKPD